MRICAIVNEQMSDEALELFVDCQMAELMVENWDRDEPDRAGELYVEPVKLETSAELAALALLEHWSGRTIPRASTSPLRGRDPFGDAPHPCAPGLNARLDGMRPGYLCRVG